MDGELVVMLLCLGGSGFFSASETALTSLPATRLEALRLKSGRLTRLGLDRWATHPQELLITILIGNNLVNVLASALATRLAYRFSERSGLALAVGGVTLIILVFGEITPKSLAQIHAESFSARVAPVLYVFDIVCRPAGFLLGLVTRLVARGRAPEVAVTEADLLFMLRLAHRHAQLPKDTRLMIESVLRFQRAVAREAMVPRPLVITVDSSWSSSEVHAFVNSSSHSRFPVVHGSPDKIMGVLHAKHLSRLPSGRIWTDAVTEPIFIPEGKALGELLDELRFTGQHLAIVLDEFGGLSGVISLEDALELLVGEIKDEFDQKDHGILEVDGGWTVPGHLSLRRLELLAQRELDPVEEVDSVGGLLGSLVQNPVVGTILEWDGLALEVLELDGQRPLKVGVKVVAETLRILDE